MTKLAHVVGGVIAEFPAVDPAILATHPDMTVEDCFPADFLAALVSAPDTAQVGWTYDGKTFAAPVIPPVPPAVRSVQGAALIHVLDKATKVCPRDLAYVAGLSSAGEDMASLARIAAVDGRKVSDWFDAALS